jgi:hypothetical protein
MPLVGQNRVELMLKDGEREGVKITLTGPDEAQDCVMNGVHDRTIASAQQSSKAAAWSLLGVKC